MTPHARRALQNLALAVLPLALLLLAAELLVRATGAGERCPGDVESTDLWECHPVLQFQMNRALRPNDEPLNRLGFRGPEFAAKRPGVTRVLSLGDSCTIGYIAHEEMIGFVQQPYPLRLQRLVEKRIGPDRLEALNAGVAGYNSYHGVLLLKTKLRGLDPDVVTVRYGWNDHFLATQGRDSSVYREPEALLLRRLEALALHTQLYAFVRRLGLELRALREPTEGRVEAAFRAAAEWTPSIPPAQYAANLRRIVELARAQGAEVWLLTAPRNPAPGEPARRQLAAHNKLPFERLMGVHDEYNQIVRDVGAEVAALVVDMDAVYRRYRGAPVFVPTDVPHPTQGGHNLEAEALYTALERRGRIPAGRRADAADASAAGETGSR